MSRTFFRKFFRPSRGPRGAPPSGLLPFAAASSVLYAPPARPGCGKPARTQDADNSSAVERKDGGRFGGEGGIGWRLASPACEAAPQSRRFAPVHRHNRPGCPALACLGPPGRTVQLRVFNYLYISRRDWAHLQARSPSAFIAQAALPPVARFPIRLRQTSHEANTSRDCFQRPRARRRVPSCSRP